MIVKKVFSEEIVTLSEVRELLLKVKEERLAEDEDEELPYEFRRALHHAESFVKLDTKQSHEIVERLSKLEKMKPEIAIRIADLLPRSRDELRAIYAKERFSLSTDELDTVLDIVNEYL